LAQHQPRRQSFKRGSAPNDPGWTNCVFCGKPVGKAARSREHIIPMWMLRATGDPNRVIKIESDLSLSET
jgi:hypothetical protein